MASDGTETESRRRRDRIDGARLRLLERAPVASMGELLTATLDLAEELTGSTIGFFHFVDEDQNGLTLQAWSTSTTSGMCSAEGKGSHYPLDRAGVWADCVRVGKPVVHNDYASAPGRKGMPAGHAAVLRELTVPVSRAGRICAVLGVGNKPTDYDDADVGDVAMLADLAWDVAARKRAEEQLRVQRERLDLAAQAGKVGLWDLDLTTNQAWRTLQHDRLFGYDALLPSWGPEDALRHVVPEDRHIFEGAFAAAMATGRMHYELRIEPAGQPVRWIEASGEVFRDAAGKPIRMMGTVVDVTERRHAEAALQRSEEHFRRLFQFLPVPIAFNDGAGNVVDLNARFTEVLGYTRADIPTLADWFRRAYPDEEYRHHVKESWGSAVAAAGAHGVIAPGEYRVTTRSGEPRIMLISGASMGEDLIVALVDVTEARALQAQLALTSRLAAMGTLVAGVAHEVNNPLAAQMADQGIALEMVREVRDRLRGAEPFARVEEARVLGDVAEALEEAQEGGQRIARIVKNLAAFGRPDPRRTRVRLGDVVVDAMRWLPATVGRVATVSVEDGGAAEVVASAGQIEQVVVNLVTNAARSIPEGRRGHIVVRIGPGGPGTSRMDVTDDGRGIEPHILERIFEPFFTTRPVGAGRGMGLGLAISHTIVTGHGGTLTVTSTPRKGSTFRMELPIATQQPIP